MIRLTKHQILLLHRDIVEESGGSPVLRDEGLLESAINTPFQTFADVELYPSVLEKAAQLGFRLIKNHAFVDGNKRIGTHAMLVFLALNGIELFYEDEDLINQILGIAASKLSVEDLLEWLQKHSLD